MICSCWERNQWITVWYDYLLTAQQCHHCPWPQNIASALALNAIKWHYFDSSFPILCVPACSMKVNDLIINFARFHAQEQRGVANRFWLSWKIYSVNVIIDCTHTRTHAHKQIVWFGVQLWDAVLQFIWTPHLSVFQKNDLCLHLIFFCWIHRLHSEGFFFFLLLWFSEWRLFWGAVDQNKLANQVNSPVHTPQNTSSMPHTSQHFCPFIPSFIVASFSVP